MYTEENEGGGLKRAVPPRTLPGWMGSTRDPKVERGESRSQENRASKHIGKERV